MRTPLKLTAYGVGLVLIFGAAAGAGRVIGPDQTPAPPAAHEDAGGHAGPAAAPRLPRLPGGLQVAEAGHRLQPITTSLPAGTFSFRILDDAGNAVTAFTETHERKMHLILVRRDLTGFRHLHPAMTADGVWSTPLPSIEAGQYRVFADFQPAGRSEGLTLGVDVPAAGTYTPEPLPAPATVARTDGYTVTLGGSLHPGTSSKLTLTVSRDGRPVDLEPYLGAYGHLVVLRAGDLAYLHVHAQDATTYFAEVPSAGDYRLYLQFQHGGKVHTAEFTAVAGQE